MKMCREVVEVSDEGLESLMGQTVTLMCGGYFYTGKLVGANETCVKLSEAGIVYETGPLDDGQWSDRQSLPGDWYVQIAAIESFGILK